MVERGLGGDFGIVGGAVRAQRGSNEGDAEA